MFDTINRNDQQPSSVSKSYNNSVNGKASGQAHPAAINMNSQMNSTQSKINSTGTGLVMTNVQSNQKQSTEHRGKSTEPYYFESEHNIPGYRVQENYCNMSLNMTAFDFSNSHQRSSQQQKASGNNSVIASSSNAQNKQTNLSNTSFDGALKEVTSIRTPAAAYVVIPSSSSRKDKSSPAHRRGKSSPLQNIINKLDKMKINSHQQQSGMALDSQNRSLASHNTSFSGTQNLPLTSINSTKHNSNTKQSNAARKFNY